MKKIKKRLNTTGVPKKTFVKYFYKGQKLDKQILVIWMITSLLALSLVFLCIQNMALKKEVKGLERQNEARVGEAINDFVGIIIEKVDTCLPVQIVSRNESAVVLGSQCLEKR